ncbi:MAG: hypothetical protein K6347_02705 [Campylobacterales bacterium]
MSREGLSFIIGVAVGAAAAYYSIKHKDEILAKMEEVEGILKEKKEAWSARAKEEFERAVAKFNQVVDKYASYVKSGASSEDQKYEIVEDLERIKQEVRGL